MGRGRATNSLIRTLCLILPAASIAARAAEAPYQSVIPSDLQAVRKRITPIEAFRPRAGLDRHDPSNVIAHEGRFWMFYTHNRGDHREVAVHAGSSADGLTWEDHGLAVGRGAAGAWDESGAIAPFCVQHAGRLYLFYTGFHGGDLSSRDLGLAIADHPRGPWLRWDGNPVLRRSPAPEAWDSGMLGDANVVFHNDRWWLFFKSRRHDQGPRDTGIGVAIADRITGPYLKHPDNPLFAGHAFSLWRHHHGLAALCGEVSPAILWSSDGLRFHPVGEFANSSVGLYTPDSKTDPEYRHGFDWGLDVVSESGSRGLVRFDRER